MTIKEAFEKLSATCSAGMKNPFFIMRNLHDAFADIAAKIEGGGSEVEVTQVVKSGTKIATISVDDESTDLYAPEDTGSEVSVTQVVSSGTKIATITVDNTSTDLYAPNSIAYSTTSRIIGTWIDGSDVYEQVTEFSSEITVSYNSWESSGIMSADIDKMIECIGIASDGATYGSIMAWNDNGDIKLQTARNNSPAYVKYLIMRYTIVSE